MKRIRRGFTLVEVALFLAITGVLFVGITVGVQNSLFQQRYNDSVQSFAEFLRSVYSGTMNVQNKIPGGRSNMAIYGKLVTFGQDKNLEDGENSDNAVYVYDVIGKVGDIGVGNVLGALDGLGANVMLAENDRAAPVGFVEEYKTRWGAGLEKTECSGTGCKFVGALLVVRHPQSGIVYTYVMDGSTLQVNEKIEEINDAISSGASVQNAIDNGNILQANLSSFQIMDVDFCINPEGDNPSDDRRDIRITAGARNASGVEVINLDSDENRCKQDG